MKFSAERINRQIERAEGRRKDQLAELLRPEGGLLFSEVEDRQRRDVIEAEYRRELRAVKETIDAESEAIRSEAVRLEDRDPLGMLSTVERSRADEQRVWVRENVEMLEEPVLIRRIEDAVEAGDKPTLALIVRYAPLRESPSIELRGAFRAAEKFVFNDGKREKLQERQREVLSVAARLAARETLSKYSPPATATTNPFQAD